MTVYALSLYWHLLFASGILKLKVDANTWANIADEATY